MRIYLDTNVFISFWKDEIAEGKLSIYFGYSSEKLLERVEDCEHFLITSKLVALEIEKKFPFMIENFKEQIEKFKQINKVRVFDISEDLVSEATKLNEQLRKSGISIGWKDCAHILMAKKYSDCFISWEKSHREVAEKFGVPFSTPYEI